MNTAESKILSHAKKVIGAVNHPLRWAIICHVLERDGATVQEIMTFALLPQNVVSSHLALLRNASVMNYKRNGHHHQYTVNMHVMKTILSLSKQLSELYKSKSPQHVQESDYHTQDTAAV